jgi:hypothetical protein
MAKKSSYRETLRRDLVELAGSLDGLSPVQLRFLEKRWLDQVLWMESAAAKAQKRYYRLRLVTVVGAVIVPALVSLNVRGSFAEGIAWVTFGLSLLVAASAAVEEFFQFGARWRHYRRTVERLKSEGWQFFQLSGQEYAKAGDHSAAYPLFAARVESLLAEDVDAYVSTVVREKGKGEQAEA